MMLEFAIVFPIFGVIFVGCIIYKICLCKFGEKSNQGGFRFGSGGGFGGGEGGFGGGGGGGCGGGGGEVVEEVVGEDVEETEGVEVEKMEGECVEATKVRVWRRRRGGC